MKANYNTTENPNAPMNRQQRKAMHKRLLPKIKRIVELEKQIKAGINKSAAENEMTQIIESCTMIEMFAIEDYIYKKKLLDNK
jgi:type II secretory pathway component PulL